MTTLPAGREPATNGKVWYWSVDGRDGAAHVIPTDWWAKLGEGLPPLYPTRDAAIAAAAEAFARMPADRRTTIETGDLSDPPDRGLGRLLGTWIK